MAGIILSILTCTMHGREAERARLQACLDHQTKDKPVEWLFDCRVNMQIGEKRNNLIDDAKGKYVAFVDDDDLVASDYVDKILAAVETTPDVVGIKGVMLTSYNYPRMFYHSITCSGHVNGTGEYFRTPNHLNPTLRELINDEQIRFPVKSFGEDYEYCLRLKSALKKEVMIKTPLYYYLYSKCNLSDWCRYKLGDDEAKA